MPDKLSASVLLAPHHGSNTSSTPNFIKMVNPKLSIFTVGRNNRWGFPKAGVLEAYSAINSRIYRTDQHGAISIHSSAGDLTISSQRRDKFRLWH